MFGRKNGLFRICLLLLPVVTVGYTSCLYSVRLTTGDLDGAGTDDTIMIKIREDGPWHSLNNPYVDDFERGNTDIFVFNAECVDRHQQTTIGNAGHAKFFVCFSNAWLVTHVIFTRLDRDWIKIWKTHKWLWCHDELKLPQK